jgi:hypothetical protein
LHFFQKKSKEQSVPRYSPLEAEVLLAIYFI